jgi:hypothetical protein
MPNTCACLLVFFLCVLIFLTLCYNLYCTIFLQLSLYGPTFWLSLEIKSYNNKMSHDLTHLLKVLSHLKVDFCIHHYMYLYI